VNHEFAETMILVLFSCMICAGIIVRVLHELDVTVRALVPYLVQAHLQLRLLTFFHITFFLFLQ
jgi:hypothetical protein